MESDYGWSLSVDFEDEYSDAEVLTPLPLDALTREDQDEGDEGGNEEEEDGEDYIPLDVSYNPKKKAKKAKEVSSGHQTLRGDGSMCVFLVVLSRKIECSKQPNTLCHIICSEI